MTASTPAARSNAATSASRTAEARCSNASKREIGSTLAPGELNQDYFRKIEANIIDDVLHARKFPQIRFVSTQVSETTEGYNIEGTLHLHGRKKHISIAARRLGDRLTTELELNQPDFGVKPYSAMMGTLKVKPKIVVRIGVPASAIPAS